MNRPSILLILMSLFFLGSDCVTYLVKNNHAATRNDAVVLGQTLLENKVFSHVTKDHSFKDEKLFYRFEVCIFNIPFLILQQSF